MCMYQAEDTLIDFLLKEIDHNVSFRQTFIFYAIQSPLRVQQDSDLSVIQTVFYHDNLKTFDFPIS